MFFYNLSFSSIVGRSTTRPNSHHGTKSVETMVDSNWRNSNSNQMNNKVKTYLIIFCKYYYVIIQKVTDEKLKRVSIIISIKIQTCTKIQKLTETSYRQWKIWLNLSYISGLRPLTNWLETVFKHFS